MENEELVTTDFMLTTHDNPYNPFEEFNLWLMFDIEKKYFTCEHLAREATITDDMSQPEIDAEMDRAIDAIIANDFLNIYKRVTPETANKHEIPDYMKE